MGRGQNEGIAEASHTNDVGARRRIEETRRSRHRALALAGSERRESALSTPSPSAHHGPVADEITLDDGRLVKLTDNGREQFTFRLAPRDATPAAVGAHVRRYLTEGIYDETPPKWLAGKLRVWEGYVRYVTHPAYPCSALALRESPEGYWTFATVKSLGFGSRERRVDVALPEHAGGGAARMAAKARKSYARLAADPHFQPDEAIEDVREALATEPWREAPPTWAESDGRWAKPASELRYVVRDDELFVLRAETDAGSRRWALIDYQRDGGAGSSEA